MGVGGSSPTPNQRIHYRAATSQWVIDRRLAAVAFEIHIRHFCAAMGAWQGGWSTQDGLGAACAARAASAACQAQNCGLPCHDLHPAPHQRRWCPWLSCLTARSTQGPGSCAARGRSPPCPRWLHTREACQQYMETRAWGKCMHGWHIRLRSQGPVTAVPMAARRGAQPSSWPTLCRPRNAAHPPIHPPENGPVSLFATSPA